MSTPIHISIYSIKQYFLHRPVAVSLISLFAPRLNPFLNSELCDVCVCVARAAHSSQSFRIVFDVAGNRSQWYNISIYVFITSVLCTTRARCVCALRGFQKRRARFKCKQIPFILRNCIWKYTCRVQSKSFWWNIQIYRILARLQLTKIHETTCDVFCCSYIFAVWLRDRSRRKQCKLWMTSTTLYWRMNEEVVFVVFCGCFTSHIRGLHGWCIDASRWIIFRLFCCCFVRQTVQGAVFLLALHAKVAN